VPIWSVSLSYRCVTMADGLALGGTRLGRHVAILRGINELGL
jgi:hypothetical protein